MSAVCVSGGGMPNSEFDRPVTAIIFKGASSRASHAVFNPLNK